MAPRKYSCTSLASPQPKREKLNEIQGDRPFANPEVAEQELLKLANAMETDHTGRLSVAVINKQFVAAGGSYDEYIPAQSPPPSRTAGSLCIRPVLICRSRKPGRTCSRRTPGRRTATLSACSTRRGKTSIGTPEAGARSVTEAGRYRGFRLLWRAKLADKPCRNPWQLQRINLIAFQAPKRAPPFTVNRYHQHHQAAAVLASPR
jgi:hypothetical protein